MLVVVSWAVRVAGLDDGLPARCVLGADGMPVRIARWVTDAGRPSAMWLVVAAAGGVLAWRRRSIRPLAALAVTQLGAVQLVRVAKRLADEPRPPVELWLVEAGGRGFPSGHALHAAAVTTAALLLAFRCRRSRPGLRWAASARAKADAVALVVLGALGVVAVAGSRVALGVHYPSDVTGGVGAGMVLAALVVALVDPRARSCPPAART